MSVFCLIEIQISFVNSEIVSGVLTDFSEYVEFSEHLVLFTIAISNVIISAFEDCNDNVT